MQFLVIICSSTMQDDVEDFFEKKQILSFTQIPEVVGAGKGGGTRLNTEVWPGTNTMYFVALPSEQADALKDWVVEYRRREVREGIKVFTLGLQELL